MTRPWAAPIIIERLGNHKNNLNICYADGHVEAKFVQADSYQALLPHFTILMILPRPPSQNSSASGTPTRKVSPSKWRATLRFPSSRARRQRRYGSSRGVFAASTYGALVRMRAGVGVVAPSSRVVWPLAPRLTARRPVAASSADGDRRHGLPVAGGVWARVADDGAGGVIAADHRLLVLAGHHHFPARVPSASIRRNKAHGAAAVGHVGAGAKAAWGRLGRRSVCRFH